MKKIEEEVIIEQVLMLCQEYGRTPTKPEFDKDPRVTSSTTVTARFGSWNNCLKAAGLKLNRTNPYSLSRELLISQVQMLAKELGRVPTASMFQESPRTASSGSVVLYFGSWNKFLEAAGLVVAKPRKPRRKKIEDKELIRQVQMLAKELGRAPSLKEFQASPKVSNNWLVRFRFGTWNNFLEAAGLESNHPYRYPNEGLIEQVQMLAKELGRTPSMREFDKDPRTMSVCTIKNRFGSWTNYVRSAGLRQLRPIDHSNDELIEQVLMMAKELGRTPTSIEFNEDSRTVCVGTIQKRFGSWNNYLETAGLEINHVCY